jgi:NTP pyrophosphatase (non-canonical NTP hydrolase)
MTTNSFVLIVQEGEAVPTPVRYDQFVQQLLKADTYPMMKLHCALGVAGEAGELADAIKKEVIYGKLMDRANIVEELGDLRFYMEGIANIYDISDQEILQGNANKLAKRYKSLTYSGEAAIARADKTGMDGS